MQSYTAVAGVAGGMFYGVWSMINYTVEQKKHGTIFSTCWQNLI